MRDINILRKWPHIGYLWCIILSSRFWLFPGLDFSFFAGVQGLQRPDAYLWCKKCQFFDKFVFIYQLGDVLNENH